MIDIEDIELLGDRIIVIPEMQKKETESGILLPDASTGKTQFGHVVSVGTGRLDQDGCVIDMDVEEGDRVMYERFAGEEIIINDTTYLLMTERNVIAIIHNEDTDEEISSGKKVLNMFDYSRKCDDDDDED